MELPDKMWREGSMAEKDITEKVLMSYADVLFNCQDAIANGEMEPAQAGAEIQAAIEAYNNK